MVNGAPEATCKEFVSATTKKQLGGISACSKTMKFKNPKEKSAKMNCKENKLFIKNYWVKAINLIRHLKMCDDQRRIA